jgi:hypothetical protein
MRVLTTAIFLVLLTRCHQDSSRPQAPGELPYRECYSLSSQGGLIITVEAKTEEALEARLAEKPRPEFEVRRYKLEAFGPYIHKAELTARPSN